MSEWQLKDSCFYVKEKINTLEVSKNNYISTENMIPIKGGITSAVNLPNAQFIDGYKQNDVLISNIRPYFKKIWFAEMDGGNSADVLVFRAKENTNAKFLYYLLSEDKFFDNMTKSAKGTKMPRGDKSAIMDFEINLPPLEEQERIAGVLSALDDKIELNNKINKNLEEQAQTIFKRWFVDFEFPDENGNPYKSSGGEMVDSELGEIPKDWEVITLSQLTDVQTGKRPQIKKDSLSTEFYVPIFGASGIMGYTNRILLESKILTIGRVGTHGVVQKITYPCWVSDNAIYFNTKYYSFIYQILKQIDYSKLNRGSTQPLITQSEIKNQLIFDTEIIQFYEEITCKFLDTIIDNEKQNKKLAEIRDYLLPKLMSGEVRV